MTACTIMIQGTGSGVGKSVITAALCRYFHRQGLRVAPFKSQNMSNNSFVTAAGGEIGRAQAFQAMACGIEPTVDMNPILLKPTSTRGSQVVLRGKAVASMDFREYHAYQPTLMAIVRESLHRLLAEHDIVVIEGAGSPAEINLRSSDIANMAIAKMAAAPVLLVGDIRLGGVFASLVGTLELLDPQERALVKGLLINKFQGDLSLLDEGLKFLEARTGKKILGVLPFVRDLAVPEEDSIFDAKAKASASDGCQRLAISVVHLPHISNSTDFESLQTEPDVSVQYLARVPEQNLPLPDLLILPGSKSTVADLAYLRSSGFSRYIQRCHAARIPIFGICGGYQMLGNEIRDPERVESEHASMEGLALLNVATVFEREKATMQVRARDVQSGREISGYEIHMGRTTGEDTASPAFEIVEEMGKPVSRFDGAKSQDGLVCGTYIHGLFDAPAARRDFLNALRKQQGWAPLQSAKQATDSERLDFLAQLIQEHVDVQALDAILKRGSECNPRVEPS